MGLTPWPTDGEPSSHVELIQILKEAIGDLPDDRVARIGVAASALVERYAPGAPQGIRDEAMIRCAGYLAQSDFGGIVSETIGPRQVSYTVNNSALFRNSGAAALLSPWKRRRAGIIG